ncbi:MAG: hypothetical protein AB7E27_01130 [Candidatus Methanomethylophilaceae archaeon]|jgi:hypothetical protein
MSPFRRKTILIAPTHMTLGEFDIEEPGGYHNVKTLPLHIKAGRELHVRIRSDRPVDLAISDQNGLCRSFREGVTDGGLGPVHFPEKELVALVLGIFRGEKAELDLEAWME